MISFTVKENHIGSAVCENLLFQTDKNKHTHTHRHHVTFTRSKIGKKKIKITLFWVLAQTQE